MLYRELCDPSLWCIPEADVFFFCLKVRLYEKCFTCNNSDCQRQIITIKNTDVKHRFGELSRPSGKTFHNVCVKIYNEQKIHLLVAGVLKLYIYITAFARRDILKIGIGITLKLLL